MLSCSVVPFSGVYLLSYGYSNSMLGVILAAGYIVGMLMQPVTATIAYKSQRLSAAEFMLLICGIHLMLTGALALCRSHSALMAVLFILFFALQIALQPHVNSFAVYIERSGIPIRFGMARGCGSLLWGLMSFLLAFLVEEHGARIILAAAAVTDIILILLLLTLKSVKVKDPPHDIRNGSYRFVREHRSYSFFLLGIVFTFFGFSFLDNFPYQIVCNVGGGSLQMGQLLSVLAFIEIPIMFAFELLYRKFGSKRLIILSSAFFTARAALVYLSRSLPQLYFATFFNTLSYGIMIPASVRFTNEVVGPYNCTKAQALLTMMMTLGSILSSLTGGRMIDVISTKGMLGVGAVAAVLGSALVLYSVCMKSQPLKYSKCTEESSSHN